MSTEGGASTVSGGGEKKSTFRLFGKKEEGDAASAAADPTVRKTKSFKRIRGLLSGESRRERKERRSKEKAATTAPATTSSSAGGTAPPESDDVATIYNVDVDERSVVTSVSSPVKAEEAKSSGDQAAPGSPDAGKKPYLLKVVLLLMDPDTRRFELLQLEFDSLKALVSDVLAQIPISVTEESLRLKSYTGITSRDGNEWSPEKLLANFCKGNDILVAVPTGVPAKECARLARPILSDDKVVSMVRNNGNCVSCNIVRSFLARLTLDHSPLVPPAAVQWNRCQGVAGEEKEAKERAEDLLPRSGGRHRRWGGRIGIVVDEDHPGDCGRRGGHCVAGFPHVHLHRHQAWSHCISWHLADQVWVVGVFAVVREQRPP